MEFASKLRWILVVFILLFVLIFVGWGLSAVARNVFNRSSGTDAISISDDVESANLEGFTSVRYIVDGPVVASTEHRKYIIEVSRNVVSMNVYSDYGQKVVKTKSYVNNTEAFDTFIDSLEQANATSRYVGTDEEDDYSDQGVCPDGRRYILELGDSVRRWTTSCDRADGTAAGKMTTMRKLFSKQIPDFEDLIEGTVLNRR
jgi:Na+-transporting methylmalonyl-CoA/oxaloacetate decarboxylase gamma subunit